MRMDRPNFHEKSPERGRMTPIKLLNRPSGSATRAVPGRASAIVAPSGHKRAPFVVIGATTRATRRQIVCLVCQHSDAFVLSKPDITKPARIKRLGVIEGDWRLQAHGRRTAQKHDRIQKTFATEIVRRRYQLEPLANDAFVAQTSFHLTGFGGNPGGIRTI